MELWIILVMQLLEAHTFLECERHPVTMCNCCLSYYIAFRNHSGFLHMVLGELEKYVTILARKSVGCEERPGGIGSVITLHLCQVLNSSDV